MAYEGSAHTFGDSVNTDYITPTDYFSEPIEVIADHVFEPIAPDFHDRFEAGDVIVAGGNFGCGSSRETAPKALKVAGVSVVVAESFARIFYRNAINVGLPIAEVAGVTDDVSSGDRIRVDLGAGVVENVTTGARFEATTLPEDLLAVLEAGGLVAYRERRREDGPAARD